MKCEEVQLVLIDYLDNTINKASRNKIEKHLESCKKCKDEVNKLQIVMQSISESKPEKPDETLRENFDTMLQSEMNKIANAKNPVEGTRVIRLSSPILKIAAGFAILVIGVLIGMKIKSGAGGNQSLQLAELKNEVKEMKEVLMFTMLNEDSPSQRIKAVNYAEEISNPNQKVTEALIHTLNNDENVNVRLAAAYSLAGFSNNQEVLDSLVASLGKQTEPIIQVVLINILAEKKEIKAIEPMQDIISNKETIKEVKDIAEKSIEILL